MSAPVLIYGPESWADDAACRDMDPRWWFARHDLPRTEIEDGIAKAKAVCSVCPVQEVCLEFALHGFNWSSDFGIWGGTTAEERQEMRRKTPSKSMQSGD